MLNFFGHDEKGRGGDFQRAFLDPAAVFATPADVVDEGWLTFAQKREILRRWAWNEYLLDFASGETTASGAPSRLEKVQDALKRLDKRPRLQGVLRLNPGASGSWLDAGAEVADTAPDQSKKVFSTEQPVGSPSWAGRNKYDVSIA